MNDLRHGIIDAVLSHVDHRIRRRRFAVQIGSGVQCDKARLIGTGKTILEHIGDLIARLCAVLFFGAVRINFELCRVKTEQQFTVCNSCTNVFSSVLFFAGVTYTDLRIRAVFSVLVGTAADGNFAVVRLTVRCEECQFRIGDRTQTQIIAWIKLK